MKSTGPQPPSEYRDAPLSHKSPRQRGVHFISERSGAPVVEEDEAVTELKEKMDAMLTILHKAKLEREELLKKLEALKKDNFTKEEMIVEGSKKRMIEEKSFRETLMRERTTFDNRLAKRSEAIEQRNNLLVEFAVFTASIGVNYPQIPVDDILRKVWQLVPSSVDPCRAIRGPIDVRQGHGNGDKKKKPKQQQQQFEAEGRKPKPSHSRPEAVPESGAGAAAAAGTSTDGGDTDNFHYANGVQNPFDDLTATFIAELDATAEGKTSGATAAATRTSPHNTSRQGTGTGTARQSSAAKDKEKGRPVAMSTSLSDGEVEELGPAFGGMESEAESDSNANGGAYMRPNPKKKGGGGGAKKKKKGGKKREQQNADGSFSYGIIGAGDDTSDEDRDRGPAGRRAMSPQEKLLVIQEMINLTGTN